LKLDANKHTNAAFVLTGIALVLCAIVASCMLASIITSARRMTDAQQALRSLGALRAHLAEAEAGERGYLLTGELSYLESIYAASGGISKDLENIRSSVAGNPSQLQKLQQLDLLVSKRQLSLIHQSIPLREAKNSAAQLNKTINEKMLANELRALTDEVEEADSGVSAQTQRELRSRLIQACVSIGFMAILCLTIVAGAKVLHVRDIASRQKAEAALQGANEQLSAANEKLKAWVEEVELRARESSLVHQMADLLQGCLSTEDAYRVVTHGCPEIFPHEAGALYLLDPARNQLELVASWGGCEIEEKNFAPNECWALRRGHSYLVRDRECGPMCSHIRHTLAGGYLCVPMMAQSETLGVLFLESRDPSRTMREYTGEAKRQLATTVAEHIALALASLKLRETLKLQSIRDPLTGLYNRRHLEECLERELKKAMRGHRSVGAIMIDLDHFKQVNDTFGHPAGDAVLKTLAKFLRNHTRAGDVVCRYGGEEFLIILPEAGLQDTLERAERLRNDVRNIDFHHRGQALGMVTLSVGVAAYPEHGLTSESLLQAADEALYRAKAEGRDRVVVSSTERVEASESGTKQLALKES
jgi:diguanylate cyclase (GGDEF)-like protein